jgi:hypothetical protein
MHFFESEGWVEGSHEVNELNEATETWSKALCPNR